MPGFLIYAVCCEDSQGWKKTLFLTASVGSELSSFFHFMGVWGGGGGVA